MKFVQPPGPDFPVQDDGSATLPEPANEDDSMSRLLHFAGPRGGMPADAKTRLEDAARLVWQVKVRDHAVRRRRQAYQSLALAAALTLAAGLAFWFAPSSGPLKGTTASVATVEARHGTATLDAAPLGAAGTSIRPGQTITTGPQGRLALRMASGASLRIDVDTRLVLRGAEDLRLDRGAIYVDTGNDEATSLSVKTHHGVARDIGTRFEVRFSDGELRIQVREGEVRLESGAESHPASAGTVITVRQDGTVERGLLPAWAAAWDWTLETRPPFATEGRTVQELLDWFCHETGLALRLAGPVAEQLASTIKAGPGPELMPLEVLDAVLPGAGLSFSVEEGTLTISPYAP